MFRDIERLEGEALAVFSGIILIGLIVMIFFLLTLQNCLKNVSPENRKMPPANVWLMFIPLFNIVYQFIMVGKIGDSLAAEFQKRGITDQEARPGYNVGLAFCICNVASNFIPVLGALVSLAGFVCLIIYWVKINNYKNQLGAYQGDDNILDRNI